MQDHDMLHILWTNADPLTSKNMVMLYAKNALKKNWWDRVQVIIWGAPAKLVAEDAEIQVLIAEAQELGVTFSACIACADRLGVTETLQALGIETIRWGEPLTEIIKDGGHLITV